jgi:hypothetical protein
MSEVTSKGRRAHLPVDYHRARVLRMAILGLSQEQIALLLGIRLKTLQHFFSAELQLGQAATPANHKKSSSSPKRYHPPSDNLPPFIPHARDVLIIRGPNGERLA